MMGKLRKNSGIKHYWNYFIENYRISFQSIIEYKANFYSSIINVFFWDLAFLIMGLIMKNNFLDIIGWDFIDYCIFLLFSYLIYNITYMFEDDKLLKFLIPRGDLNKYLCMPGNRFFNYFLNIKFNTIIINLGNIVIFTPLIIIYGNITYQYFHLTAFIFILLVILDIVLAQFVNSISFFILKFFDIFTSIYGSAGYTMQGYTPLFFEKSSYWFLLLFFHLFFIAKLIIPLFHGIFIDYFWNYILCIISLIVVFSIGTAILWHYGLKKYEAFG